MCGIVAVFGKNTYSIAKAALNKIKHRGKDATKLLQLSFGTIGFNRLSINDKSDKAMQPFEFGNLVGVFNAEIFNAAELKTKFELKTNSNSDTEIILPLFEKIGSSIIHQLDGFYSGIIFNKHTNQILTIRDYIGKKPLFYANTEQFDFITSELKAVEQITKFEIIPKGVCEISNKKIVKIEEHKIPIVYKSNLKEMIINAVKKRIPKEEKKFGVFLSGGLDSSIVAAVVSKFSDKAIFYTLGNSETLDFKFIIELSKALSIEKYLKIISLPAENEISELISKAVYHTESYNPSIVSNGLATYLLSKAADDDGIKVVLSGEGADELFCGYSISKDANEWFAKRIELIENMHFTELRRLDLSSMANTIEIRCPFLDRNVFAASNECLQNDLIETKNGNLQGKKILRELFLNELPKAIAERNKVSFDVGSGIRKLVVEHLTKSNCSEKESLKTVWVKHFPANLSGEKYFHSYPTFDKAIATRSTAHK
jgi:asparagine synthase (glutamine-hydrolysing)